MFLWIMAFILLGIIIGTLTGMIPGLHPNTVFVFTLSLLPLLSGFPIQCVIVFVVSLAITNTFTDFLPSIIFGAPDASTALSVLPAHRMLLKGRGYEALMLTVVGGLLVSVVTVITLPVMFHTIPIIYSIIHNYIHIILIIVVMWMIFTEKGVNRLLAIFIFLLSGILGFITLNTLSSENVLFPALSGLFGLSIMFTSVMGRTKIPPQEITNDVKCNFFKGTVASWFSGLLVGLLPGVGSSQAGIISSQLLKNKTKEFLMTLGGINTANMFFTILVFYLLGKTRSGAAWTISQVTTILSFNDILLIVFTILFSSCISAIVTLRIGKIIMSRLDMFPYRTILASIILFIIASVSIFTGTMGIIILFTCFFIGLFSTLLGLNRTHLMGFLIFPTLMYFSGVNIHLLNFLGL